MTVAYSFYKILTRVLAPLGPVFEKASGVLGGDPGVMAQRWGRYPEDLKRSLQTRPRVWIHAASVGEVGVTGAILQELGKEAPDCGILVSTTTKTGRDQAKKKLPVRIPLVYAPLDIPSVVDRALSLIKPDVLVFVETEIWPNWVCRAHDRGIKILLVNGRVSTRSIGKYLRVRSLMAETLKRFEVLSMIHQEDGDRIMLMGGEAGKIRIHGNAKFDGLDRLDDPEVRRTMARIYAVEEGDRIWVAGSTREGEEALVLKAFAAVRNSHPDVRLFLAPRHVERAGDVAALVKRSGFSLRKRSGFGAGVEDRNAAVTLIDTLGELASVYGLGTLCFCGGSLVPKGGQNLLEPAAWGKPVFYGPCMEDFKEARDLIEGAVGEAFLVKSWEDLAEKVCVCLENPDLGRDQGAKARAAILKNSGAARKHALEILKAVYPQAFSS